VTGRKEGQVLFIPKLLKAGWKPQDGGLVLLFSGVNPSVLPLCQEFSWDGPVAALGDPS